MQDISMEEGEELPRILGLIAEDAPAAVLGGASGIDETPVDCTSSPVSCRELCCADDLLAMRDISMDESEELPRILSPIAEDAPAAVLGGASALDQTPVDRDLLITAIEAASPNLIRLKVSACGHHESGMVHSSSCGTLAHGQQRSCFAYTPCPSMYERVRDTLQEVLFVMGANLSQIEERWDSGRLRTTGLSSQHVISLVRSASPHPFPLSTCFCTFAVLWCRHKAFYALLDKPGH